MSERAVRRAWFSQPPPERNITAGRLTQFAVTESLGCIMSTYNVSLPFMAYTAVESVRLPVLTAFAASRHVAQAANSKFRDFILWKILQKGLFPNCRL